MHALKFAKHTAFKYALDEQVASYFKRQDLSSRDSPLMYAKAAFILVWAIASYVALVFYSTGPLFAIGSALSLSVALWAIGLNIQHDANHGALSKYGWVNRLGGNTLDFLGVSSWFWKMKHNVMHHTFTNIEGKDVDIAFAPLARLSPAQPHFWYHRYQHLYMWCFYTLSHSRFIYVDIVHRLFYKKMGVEKVDLPRKWEMVELVTGKVMFLAIAVAIPLYFHPAWAVLVFYTGVSLLMGFLFAVVFQMAHMVDAVEHPGSLKGQTEHEFVLHQIQTTADFAPDSKLWAMVLGGLNFQREHHLFPRISHVHYPAVAKVVKKVCAEYGVECHEYPSVWTALQSHYRFLKLMGGK